MLQTIRDVIGKRLIAWLNKPRDVYGGSLSDFERLSQEILPGDVLLVEGKTQVSQIIQMVTHSRWSHSALYVGKLTEIQEHLPNEFDQSGLKTDKSYVIEAELGKGTILTPLDAYHDFRSRVCRPIGITGHDRQRVCRYALHRLGAGYNVRQLADLARFLFPYGILPRTWRSTLFQHNAGPETKIVCSTLIADAFQMVSFPVLPIYSKGSSGKNRLFKRNSRLFAPSDFDISPFFNIVKFPYFSSAEPRYYRYLPWAERHEESPAEHDPEIATQYRPQLEETAEPIQTSDETDPADTATDQPELNIKGVI